MNSSIELLHFPCVWCNTYFHLTTWNLLCRSMRSRAPLNGSSLERAFSSFSLSLCLSAISPPSFATILGLLHSHSRDILLPTPVHRLTNVASMYLFISLWCCAKRTTRELSGKIEDLTRGSTSLFHIYIQFYFYFSQYSLLLNKR